MVQLLSLEHTLVWTSILTTRLWFGLLLSLRQLRYDLFIMCLWLYFGTNYRTSDSTLVLPSITLTLVWYELSTVWTTSLLTVLWHWLQYLWQFHGLSYRASDSSMVRSTCRLLLLSVCGFLRLAFPFVADLCVPLVPTCMSWTTLRYEQLYFWQLCGTDCYTSDSVMDWTIALLTVLWFGVLSYYNYSHCVAFL